MSRSPGCSTRTAVCGAIRPVASTNRRTGVIGSVSRWAPIERSVPQWIGSDLGRADQRGGLAPRSRGSGGRAGIRGPQPQIGSAARSTRPASAAIPSNRSVSPAK